MSKGIIDLLLESIFDANWKGRRKMMKKGVRK